MSEKKLLIIVELGGYPDFTPIYQKAGYQVETATSMRKALGLLKKNDYDMVVCEFNFQSDFRDRTSSLESLMSVVQRMPECRVIVFYEQEFAHQSRVPGGTACDDMNPVDFFQGLPGKICLFQQDISGFQGNSSGYGFLQTAGLFEDFLEHEMAVSSFFSHFRAPLNLLCGDLDLLSLEILHPDP